MMETEKEMTLEQLKAYAYDLMVARDRAQYNLNKINQEIARKEKEEHESGDYRMLEIEERK